MKAGESQPYFIDSNIWLYRFIIDPNDANAILKQQTAINITNYLHIIISTQVVNEVCVNLIRKAKFDNHQIQTLIEELAQGCDIVPVSLNTLQSAATLRHQYSLSFWDSLIIASAILGDAKILYSEDMQDSVVINNTLQIINPFKNFPP